MYDNFTFHVKLDMQASGLLLSALMTEPLDNI